MRKYIFAQMMPDPCPGYQDSLIPMVSCSNHPRFAASTRLDWELVPMALQDGYDVTIWAQAAGTPSTECTARFGDYACVLRAGHTGEHQAYGASGHMCARWWAE